MGQGESHFSQKWPLANVGESGESSDMAWRMSASLASPRKSAWRMSASLASPRKSAWQMLASLASTCQVLAHDKVGRFRHKLHILYV
jgi:hypothetical protein